MQIECIDSFTAWLVKELKPICDAEPGALAKYVLALLRKPDKSEEDLREICNGQLEVFLPGSTAKFVNKMFTVLNDGSYIVSKKEPEVEKEKEVAVPPPTPPPETKSKTREKAKSSSPSGKEREQQRGKEDARRTRDREDVRPTTSREPKDRDREDNHPKRRAIAAPEQSKKEEAGGNSSRAERAPRKRISPPAAESKRGGDARDRENREPARRRSRSPRDRRQRGRRSPDYGRRHVKRSRSRSPERRDKRSDEEKRKKRCRDYDEQGFCMRGDLCHYDHGPDPLVVDNENPLEKLAKLPPPAKAAINPFTVPPPGYNPMNPPPPGVEGGGFAAPPPATAAAAPVEGYNPEAPAITGANFTVPPPPLPVHMNNGAAPWRPAPYGMQQQRQGAVGVYDGGAGSVPVDPSSAGNIQPSRGGASIRGRGRGGMNMGGRFPQQNRGDGKTILVKKIPVEQNNITKLNEHFAAFGNVVNMQVRYNGEPDAAVVTYASRHEAVAAMKSPAPVLNNRFIRTFWLNPEENGAGPKTTTTYSAAGSIQRSVLNSGVRVEQPVATPPVINEPPPKVTTVKEAKFVNPAVMEARKKINQAKQDRKELTLKHAGVKTQQDKSLVLMDGLIKQQKNVLSMLRTKKLDDEKKKKLKAMAKEVSQEITKVKAEMDGRVKELAAIAEQFSELDKIIAANSPVLSAEGEEDRESPRPEAEGETEGSVRVVTTKNLKRTAEQAGHIDEADVGGKKLPNALIVEGVKLNQEQALVEQMQLFGELRDVEILSGSQEDAVFSFTFKSTEDAEMALSSDIKFNGVSLAKRMRNDAIGNGAGGANGAVVNKQLSASELLDGIGQNDED